MDFIYCIASLRRFPAMISAILDQVPPETWRRKPASGNWSILEILCHLRDEEREDFRPRLMSTLNAPEEPWLPLDPVGAAVTRKYQQQDPSAVLQEFLTERRMSLDWLEQLTDAQWLRAYRHPKLGDIRAGDLLSAWAAHDLLHVRQITKRLYESLTEACHPFRADYAGNWAES